MSLSVVVAARNCEERIEGALRPWLAIAKEVIVVDQMSEDSTAAIARKLGATVYEKNPPNGNFDLNRKFGLESATSEWLLYIDTDERPTPELLSELKAFLSDPRSSRFSGVKIPNSFYFVGAPLRYGLYSPKSSEIRLFRTGTWDYPCEKGYHRGVSVQGLVHVFRNGYLHFNVNSLSEWFQKTDQYTEFDASNGGQDGEFRSVFSTIYRAFRFFLRHYFWKQGYRDGTRGFISIFYFSLYHVTLDFKRWEKRVLSSAVPERDFLPSPKMKRRVNA